MTIDNDIDVYHVCENVVHELLKSCRSISKAFWHYQPLKGSVSSPESGFPFVSLGNAYEMILGDWSSDVCSSDLNVIHESLKSCRSVSKAFRHYQPLERSVSSLESCFPFISFGDAYKVIRVLEIYFGVDLCFSWCI